MGLVQLQREELHNGINRIALEHQVDLHLQTEADAEV